MKIRLERSGGFAGMTTTLEVVTDSLSEEERGLVTRLIDDADFLALPASISRSDSRGADRFNYRITIESPESTHTVEVAEAFVPESLEPLITWLNRRGRNDRTDP